MIRWKYLLPRLGVCLILVLLVNLFASPLTQWLLVRSMQQVTGARVEIEKVHASLWTTQLQLKALQIADPRQPMQNLLQAEVATLSFDTSQLLSRRFIVDKAQVRGVQFGTPRTTSGLLQQTEASQDSVTESITSLIQSRLRDQGTLWLEDAYSQIPGFIESNLETVQISQELQTRWPAEFQRQRERVMDLVAQSKELKATLEQRSENPLRDIEKYQKALSQFREVVSQIDVAKESLHELGRQFQQDKQRLIAAKERDRHKLLQARRAVTFDSDQLSELLLGSIEVETVRDLVNWIQWFRAAVPDPESDFQPLRQRGYDVLFRNDPQICDSRSRTFRRRATRWRDDSFCRSC